MSYKIVAIGDIHGRSEWKLILHKEVPYDRVVIIGDYFDTHQDISPAVQMFNFKEIVEQKKALGDRMILLIGNHDLHYFPEIGYNGTSGYQSGAASAISQLLDENRQYLQMAYAEQGVLFTHAGVSRTWLENVGYSFEEDKSVAEFVNDLWKYKPKLFNFTGVWDQTGDEITQTPVWIRPISLLRDSKDLGWIQVVGHTQVTRIDIQGKATGGKLYLIDTLGTSGEYLIIEDGKFKLGRHDN